MHTAFVVHLLAKLAASGRVILCSVSKTINRYLFMFKVLLTTGLLTLHCRMLVKNLIPQIDVMPSPPTIQAMAVKVRAEAILHRADAVELQPPPREEPT